MRGNYPDNSITFDDLAIVWIILNTGIVLRQRLPTFGWAIHKVLINNSKI